MTHAAAGEGDDPLIGALLADRYRLLEKIGEGGVGAVYRGVHETLRKPVAVKLLGRAARADREMVTRFEREAVAAANLKHPGIAEASDFGQTPDGLLFLVMEYVQGRSLRELVAEEGRLPPARALHLLRQVGAAVAFAHGREVVHRDLKPANVVVFDRDEERDLVKVIDFGIARMRSSFGGGPSGLTQVGTVVGTVEYMAPEQAMGQAVDARADQYALGVMAFELLTGEPPYAADDAASLVYMHVGAPIPSATERAPDLPGTVDAVLARMMGKLPDERFASVAEAMTALTDAFARPSPVAPDLTPPAVSAMRVRTPATAAPGGPGVTGGGTLLTDGALARGPSYAASRAGAYAGPLPPAPAPLPPALPGPAPPGPAAPDGARPTVSRDLPILLISGLVSLLGLAVILAIVLSRWTSTSSSETAGASASGAAGGDAPPTLAPTSHDPGGHGKPKGKGKKH
jgi:serine/threonine-protein kinase